MLTDGQQLAEPLSGFILLLGVLAVHALHLGGQLVQLLRSGRAGSSARVKWPLIMMYQPISAPHAPVSAWPRAQARTLFCIASEVRAELSSIA
jgi:hypothetical protein